MLSTLWRFDSFDAILEKWTNALKETDTEVVQLLNEVAHKFSSLRFLPENRKIWGRDIVQLYAIGKFFYEWKKATRN